MDKPSQQEGGLRSQQGTLVTVRHLPVHVVEQLDKKYGTLLAENGGYAEWLLKIDQGRIRYIETKQREFLEPTHEAKSLPIRK